MFSAYPDGWPGLALLLLRAAAGSVLVVQAITFYQEEQTLKVLIVTTIGATVLAGILLCIGLLTRLATSVAALSTLGSILSRVPVPRSALFETRSTAVLTLVIAAAVAGMGPGAFSFDARLFGRREVIIPKNHDQNRV